MRVTFWDFLATDRRRMAMKPELRELILRILENHRIMTLSTIRSDGWPHASVVSYLNEGLILNCFVSRISQKYANLSLDTRVSGTVACDFTELSGIKGVSLAGKASLVENPHEYDRIYNLFVERFPEYA